MELDCTDDELTKITKTADEYHVKFHEMDDNQMEKAADLLDDQVEKFAVATVEIPRRIGESAVTVYGIAPDSRYWTHADVSVNRVLTGEGLLKKCEVELGKKFTAHDQTQNEDHTLTVDGTCNNGYDLNIYMSMEQFSELFDKDANHVNGFASDEELDESYVTFDLTPDKMRSMADQMQDSMGQVMQLMVMLDTPLYFVPMYLFTKTVIDRSAQAISYMNVFGYHLAAIVRLYVHTITLTVAFSLVTTVPILIEIFRVAMTYMVADYSGNVVIEVPGI